MRPTVFIIAGHNAKSPGALGFDGVYEHTRTTDLQKRVSQNTASITCLQGTSMAVVTDDENSANSAVRSWIEKNKTPKSRGIDIHFNNNNTLATGTEVIIDPRTSLENQRRAIWLVNNVSRALGIPIRRRDTRRDFIFPSESHVGALPIIEDTSIPMILLEICFLNSRDLAKYIGKEDIVAHIIRQGMIVLNFTQSGSEHQLITLPTFKY